MATPVVVTKKRREELLESPQFPFTERDLPIWAQDGDIPEALKEYHLRAWGLFQTIPMPSLTDEAWRRTDIRGLKASELTLYPVLQKRSLRPPRDLLKPLVGKKHGGQVVLVPAHAATVSVDEEWQKKGVIFTDLKTARKHHAEFLLSTLGQIVRPEEGKFAALAAAFAEDGVVLYIPSGVRL
ncbi:MAG: hypothetical protein RML93_00030, partial [Anaerolineales bacterium]|nr:hypothetical protein [Anaerolineales bacterium]MDW8445657.1 hypothetical protein [Anaerolineales bacterium]